MIHTIALDAMGGDHGPKVTIPAALGVLKKQSDLKLILVGDQDALSKTLKQNSASVNERLVIHHTTQCVEMDERPSQALRFKKDSSMRVAINLVKEGVAQACVSAGNTGALMATARYVLKTLPGVDRPAIIAAMPTIKGHTHMLDLGANVDSCADQLFQFAVMGSILTSAVDNIDKPTVGLLNIGEEEIKGNDRIKEAARMLADSGINYIGFIEGDDIYTGKVDVVVCDGFVGNIALKTSEGLARMVSHYMKQEFIRTPLSRLAGLFARPVLRAFRNRIDPAKYNGASFVGLQGIVVKSHGGASADAFASAIYEASLEINKNVPELIGHQLESFMLERQAI